MDTTFESVFQLILLSLLGIGCYVAGYYERKKQQKKSRIQNHYQL